MADSNPPPPDYMAAMMQQFELHRQFMQGVIDQFPRPNEHHQPAVITLPEFVRLNPVTFYNSTNPLDADDWLRDIFFEMESAAVPPHSYVTFATYFLKGPAAQWWATHRQTLPPATVVTWEEFKIAFRTRYIPQAVIARKKAEFRSLVQGNKTVETYQREFLELSRYADTDLPTNAHRREKFQEGLHHDIQLALLGHDCDDFATLVNKAITIETGLKKHKEATRRTREAGSSSGSSSQKCRIWFPQSMYRPPAPVYRPNAPVYRPAYAASRLPPPPPRQPLRAAPPRALAPRPDSGLCFKCGQPGHRARDCSQNQNQLAFPSAGRGNSQPRYSNVRPSYGRGQNYHVNMAEAQEQPETVMGTLLVNSVPASVLFDSGASHSFMSSHFALLHDIKCETMPQSLSVNTPAGQCRASLFSPEVTIEIERLKFRAFPIILNNSSIDLILGMDWLKAHYA